MKFLTIFALIFAVTSAIHIECRFYIKWWFDASLYTCNVISIDFSVDPTHILSYGGEHFVDKSSNDVKMVEFEGQYCFRFNLARMPRGFTNIFPNVIGLSFMECAFDTLNNELDEYQNLKYFRVVVGQLWSIPRNIFASNLNLTHIDLDLNQIQYVESGLLDHLNNLVYANFDRNVCIQMVAREREEIPGLIEALNSQCGNDY